MFGETKTQKTMDKVKSIEQLKELDLNPYNTSGFVTDFSNFYTVEDFIDSWDMYYDEESLFVYAINWEDPDLMSEDGQSIPPAYGE
jgi:hypothetical protein